MAAQYIPIKRISSLDTPIKAEKLDGSLFTTENQAHEFIISVRKNGVKQTVTGSVSGKFIRANGTTIFLQGSIVDGDAVVRLHQDCYNVQGRFTFNIFNTQSGVTTCIYSAVGKIDMGSTETVIDAGDVVPDVSDVVAAQEAAQATINAANAAAQTANTAAQNVGSIVARPYSSSLTYTAGDYCTNNGSLYKANQDISTAEEWTASHWTQIVMGDEVACLKSALYQTNDLQDAALWENGALSAGDGSTFQSDTRIVTKDWIPVSKGSTLTILNSYRFSYAVNSEPTVGAAYRLESKTLGQMVQTVTISHSGYIRVAIAPPSDTSVDVSIRSNLDANILSSRFDEVYENIENLTDEIEKTQNDVEATKSRFDDVIKSSINLIDTDQNAENYYINKNTGEVVTYAGWDASAYIPVKQAEYVAIFKGSNGWEYSPTIYMAFYDANKHYTHGMSVVPNAPYMQAVAGDAYARISYGRITNPDIMFGTREDLEGYIGTSKDRVMTGNYIEDDLNYKKFESLPVRIIMPDKVVALVDEQFDIHYDNVLCYGNIKTIPYKEMFGSSFTCMENMARAQVATAGEGNNSLRLYSSVPSAFTGTQLPSTVLKKVFVFKSIEKTSGAGITRNVLLIGDSTTAPGIYARELKALFEAETEPMNIRLLGTLGNGGAEVGAETGYHEGHGGYSCKTYCTTAYHNGYNNHFYNPTTQTFDFSYYMTYTGFTNIADVFIVMGINDVAAMEDYDEMMTYFRQMVTSIRSANSFDGQPARVFFALCIPPAEYEYSDMNNNSQRSKTRRLLLHDRLIEEWGNRESEGFYIVPLNLSIDPEHDFKTEQRARSFRDQTMVTYCTDNVHPSTIAYNKMADRIRTYIKYAEI